MRLRRILHAGLERRTGRIRPEVEQLEITFIPLTKSDSGCSPPDGIHVELDGSVAERDILEHRTAAVQPHEPVIKAQLPQKFRVLLRLPMVGRHWDRDRFCRLGNRQCQRKACAKCQTLHCDLADQRLHCPSLWTVHPLRPAKGDEADECVARRSLEIADWLFI